MISICQQNKVISEITHDFITNVSMIGEESITDFLLWQWREADKKFNYLNLKKFTKEEENKKSGADIELELWLVGETNSIALAIQAKKFLKRYHGYCAKLNYLAKHQRQIDLLLDYAKKNKKYPFYLIYSLPDKKTKVMCNNNGVYPLKDKLSLYLADAHNIKTISNNCKNKKLSKNFILKQSNPFWCLFCCPKARNSFNEYISFYYPKLSGYSNQEFIYNSNNIPSYVQALLNNNVTEYYENDEHSGRKEEGLENIRNIAVLDMRDNENKIADKDNSCETN